VTASLGIAAATCLQLVWGTTFHPHTQGGTRVCRALSHTLVASLHCTLLAPATLSGAVHRCPSLCWRRCAVPRNRGGHMPAGRFPRNPEWGEGVPGVCRLSCGAQGQ
jgi:hypothetical protein